MRLSTSLPTDPPSRDELLVSVTDSASFPLSAETAKVSALLLLCPDNFQVVGRFGIMYNYPQLNFFMECVKSFCSPPNTTWRTLMPWT